MCALAYYCLFHRNTPRTPIFLCCGVNQGSERSFYTLQSLTPPGTTGALTLDYMQRIVQSVLTSANKSTLRNMMCNRRCCALICLCACLPGTVTLTPRTLSCNSGIYSEYLRNMQYFSGRSRPRVRNRTPPRHTLTPTRERAAPVQRGAGRTAGKERKGERSAWRFCVT